MMPRNSPDLTAWPDLSQNATLASQDNHMRLMDGGIYQKSHRSWAVPINGCLFGCLKFRKEAPLTDAMGAPHVKLMLNLEIRFNQKNYLVLKCTLHRELPSSTCARGLCLPNNVQKPATGGVQSSMQVLFKKRHCTLVHLHKRSVELVSQRSSRFCIPLMGVPESRSLRMSCVFNSV